MDSVLGGMIVANLIVAVAAFLQASVGVGFAMIAVPLLLILDPELVPVPVLSAMTVLAAAMLIRERDAFDRKGVMALLPSVGGRCFCDAVFTAAACEYG